MKKTMFVPVLSLVISLTTSCIASAQQGTRLPELKIEAAGELNDKALFKIGCINARSEQYLLSIKDAAGFVFYEEKLKARTYSKTFLIDIPVEDGVELIVTLEARSGHEKKTYKLSPRALQVNELIVSNH